MIKFDQNRNRTNIPFSQSPTVVKRHIPLSFNLKMVDFKVKQTPKVNFLLKQNSSNPLTNLKLFNMNCKNSDSPKKTQIVFKNKSHNKYKAKVNIKTNPIFKSIRASRNKEKFISQEIKNKEILGNEQHQEFFQAEHEHLNAKLNFQTQLMQNPKDHNTGKLLKITDYLFNQKESFQLTKIKSSSMNLCGLSRNFSENKGKRAQSSKKQTRPLSTARSLGNSDFEYLKRKNDIIFNFKRDLIMRHGSKDKYATLKRSNTTGIISQTRKKSILTDTLFDEKTVDESDPTVFKIQGSRAPDLEVSKPWKRVLSQARNCGD